MKKGLKTIIAGILIFLTAVALSVTLLVSSFSEMIKSSGANQFLIPGSNKLKVEEAGRYYLWNDYQTIFKGESYSFSSKIPNGLKFEFIDNNGNLLPFISSTSSTSNTGSSNKQSIGYVDIASPTEIEILVNGECSPRVFSFTPFNIFEIVGKVFAGIGGMMIGGFIGIGLCVWGGFKMHESSKKA